MFALGIGFGGGEFDQMMLRRERAGWVGHGRISGKQERLAAAAPEVFGAAVATAAWFGHPLLAAKALEG